MRSDRTPDEHIGSEELFGFIEGHLGRRQRRRLERHLNQCPDCVEYLASVMRSQRMDAAGEPLPSDAGGRVPEELLRRLRPHIIATSPGATSRASRGGSRWAWSQWVPAAAAVTVLLVAFGLVQRLVISPARSRQLAAQALAELTTLRQATGRLPLRYVPDFRRARVTRSGFDTSDPAERLIEQQLRRAVELAPAEPESQIGLGLFLLDRARLEEAGQRFERALELDPESTTALNGLAVVYYERALRDPPRARELLREGLTLLRRARRRRPEDLQVAFNIAMFYEELGAEDAARQSWSVYLARDADSEWAEVAKDKLQELGGR